MATLVNGGYPGPLIFANKGDTLKINVVNKLKDPSMYQTTSIHWHGLLQHRNADDDGPAFVTQVMPIIPEASYTYTIPLEDQTGTYWYHSHLRSQYVDGLRGPLVIYGLSSHNSAFCTSAPNLISRRPQRPHRHLYDVDDEKTVLIIGDWYHSSSKEILESRNITRQRPDSGTINGKGRFDPDTMPANSDTLYTLKVKRGKRYRLRIINSSAIASYRVDIPSHKMTVIAADGVSTQPYKVDRFDILAGQRIDVVLEANQEPDTYWINAPMTNVANKTAQALSFTRKTRGHPTLQGAIPQVGVSVQEGIKPRMIEGGHVALLHGRDFVKRQNETSANTTTPVIMDEAKLVPLENPGAACGSKPADSFWILLLAWFNFTSGHWMINGIPYEFPNIPTLLKILTDKDAVTESDFTKPEHTVILPKGKCIEFNIKGTSGLGILHPIHLHGHTFDVVQFGNNIPNYINPPRRDTVGSLDSGVRIQFKTDNPGPWFLHCHIDWHLEEGFAMVFAEAPEAIKQGPNSVPVDQQWRDLCRKYETLPPGFL
ncbi:multicopper oxidase family [Rhizoctonia solani]|uniref:Multicopper oxidase family n=1 Tax=Rhizoctonia solani TaxID=456999 RepID=A0A8H7I923_9AGAM|nr:multicopper oxidase family [Rhizoctonia solani]